MTNSKGTLLQRFAASPHPHNFHAGRTLHEQPSAKSVTVRLDKDTQEALEFIVAAYRRRGASASVISRQSTVVQAIQSLAAQFRAQEAQGIGLFATNPQEQS